MDKEQVIKILKRASLFEQGKEVALAKEFISIEENINNIDSKISEVQTKLNEPITIKVTWI